MKKLSETYKKLGIDFTFPIEINDANGNETYCENSEGYWSKYEYDSNGNRTYYEDSEGFWRKYEYDANDNPTYYKTSAGYWYKREFDANANETYYEDSGGVKKGTPHSSKTCEGKVVEVDGIKYKLTAL